jgi:hypothetical protein
MSKVDEKREAEIVAFTNEVSEHICAPTINLTESENISYFVVVATIAVNAMIRFSGFEESKKHVQHIFDSFEKKKKGVENVET